MKRYIDPEERWITVGSTEYTAREDAEREWERLDSLYGHDTYHRLVVVRRKILRAA